MYDFPVEEQKLFTREITAGLGKEFTVVPNKKAITRLDTGHCLAIVSDSYEIVPHAFVLSCFDSVPEITRTREGTAKNGAVMFAEYGFRKECKRDIAKDDPVEMKLRVFNSYDMSFGVGYELFGRRLVCKNGLVVPRSFDRVSLKHIKGVNIRELEHNICSTIIKTSDVWSLWQNWATTPLNIDRLKEFYDKLSKKEISETQAKSMYEKSFNMVSLWDAFNVVTHWTTHEFKPRKNAMLNRRKKEQDLIGSFYKFNWN